MVCFDMHFSIIGLSNQPAAAGLAGWLISRLAFSNLLQPADLYQPANLNQPADLYQPADSNQSPMYKQRIHRLQ